MHTDTATHQDTLLKGHFAGDIVPRAQGIAYVLASHTFYPVMESRWKPLRWMDVDLRLSWERTVPQASVDMLVLIGRLLHRITLGTQAVAVPDLAAMNTTCGQDWDRFSGLYVTGEDAIIMAMSKGGCWALLDTALHEAMHAAWHTRLSEEHIDMLTDAVAGGLDMPNEYYDRADEQVSRALLRGEPAVGLRAPVAAWLASLAPEPRHALAAMPSETVAAVLAGATAEGIPAYDDDAWTRTALIASVTADVRAGRPVGQPPMTTQERQDAFHASLGLDPAAVDDDARREAFRTALAARFAVPEQVMSAQVPS